MLDDSFKVIEAELQNVFVRCGLLTLSAAHHTAVAARSEQKSLNAM
jgi:hypothetical protein